MTQLAAGLTLGAFLRLHSMPTSTVRLHGSQVPQILVSVGPGQLRFEGLARRYSLLSKVRITISNFSSSRQDVQVELLVRVPTSWEGCMADLFAKRDDPAQYHDYVIAPHRKLVLWWSPTAQSGYYLPAIGRRYRFECDTAPWDGSGYAVQSHPFVFQK